MEFLDCLMSFCYIFYPYIYTIVVITKSVKCYIWLFLRCHAKQLSMYGFLFELFFHCYIVILLPVSSCLVQQILFTDLYKVELDILKWAFFFYLFWVFLIGYLQQHHARPLYWNKQIHQYDKLIYQYNGADKNICRANFQQRSFLATFTMDVFLIRGSLWDLHIFSNYRKWWCHFHE